MRVLGIDPGSTSLGAAILEDEHCIWHAYLSSMQPSRYCPDDPICRWWVRLSRIVENHTPRVIVYESYVYQGGRRTTDNAPAMWQQIGLIRALGAIEGVDQVVGIRPEEWRRQLTRNAKAGDHEVAAILNLRLGIKPLKQYGRSHGSHVLDAVGVALVWQDRQTVCAKARGDVQRLSARA